MANPAKNFAISGDKIRQLAPGRGGCIASDLITVQGNPVGYMYRDAPRNGYDSGWVFLAGSESPEYMDEPTNHGIYDVNTIANYDLGIIPLIDTVAPCAFERVGGAGKFIPVPPPEVND